MKYGTLYLIPSTLGDSVPALTIPAGTINIANGLKHFAVEEVRTARRFLSACGLKGKIDDLVFYEINEHTSPDTIEQYVSVLKSGNDMGLISEAGLPAVADPGAFLVQLAHKEDIKVVPLSGPSSLLLALMASGMNGQCFAFNGYLPVKSDERRSRIKDLERISSKFSQSEIIIETPYRNDRLLSDMLEVCNPQTRICIAADITLASELIKTRTVSEWRQHPLQIGKRPCVFIIYSGI